MSVFSCHLYSCKNLANEKEYFVPINSHLKKNESVCCMFVGCSFQSSIYGTFKSHKNLRHTPHTLNDFKPGAMRTTTAASLSLDHSLPDGQDEECIEEDSSGTSQIGVIKTRYSQVQLSSSSLTEVGIYSQCPRHIYWWFLTRTLLLDKLCISPTI